jgi:hypothetical protein
LILDDHIKGLLKKLGSALHQAMAESDEVKDVTTRIREEGFNLFLVMEAKVALEKKDDQEPGNIYMRPPEETESIRVNMTQFDKDFLSGMQIRIDSPED